MPELNDTEFIVFVTFNAPVVMFDDNTLFKVEFVVTVRLFEITFNKFEFVDVMFVKLLFTEAKLLGTVKLLTVAFVEFNDIIAPVLDLKFDVETFVNNPLLVVELTVNKDPVDKLTAFVEDKIVCPVTIKFVDV